MKTIIINTIIILNLFAINIHPQFFDYYEMDYNLNSGLLNNSSGETQMLFQTTITVKNAPWLSIYFDEYNLGSDSFIKIISKYDNCKQFLNHEQMIIWEKKSAFFNGNTVEIQLFVGPNDTGIFFNIN